MTTEPVWLAVMPEIREAKGRADAAVKAFGETLGELTKSLGATPPVDDEVIQRYTAAHTVWTELFNSTERLAGLGVALAQDFPVQARILVAGTVIELLENILNSAAILSSSAHQLGQPDPLQYIREQARAMEVAQELTAISFPDAVSHYRGRFESFSLPISGFSKALAAPSSVAPSPATPSPTSAFGTRLGDQIRILHISDLHRTDDEKVGNPEVLSDLARAIESLDPEQLDLIVLSGDVAQTAVAKEYEEAELFLRELVKRFLNGKMERLIVTPGNHDISWSECKKQAFSLLRDQSPDDGRQRHGLVRIENGHMLPSVKALKAGQKNFRSFYRRLFGRDYPEATNKRFEYLDLAPTGLPIGIVALDTTAGIHHMNDTADVDREALVAVLDSVPPVRPARLIAVGHHGPIRKRRQVDGIESWVLDRLLDAGVSAYIHGHVHETQVSYFSRDGILGLSCLGVGTLVAGPKQRTESTPRHYQILEIPLRERVGRIRVRRKDTRDRAWTADMRYGNKANPVDYLEFRI